MTSGAKKIIVGISGASGAIYAQRLLDLLDKAVAEVHVIASDLARQIFAEELNITELTAQALVGRAQTNLNFHDNTNLFSPLASGSFLTDAMVICPCSSHSVSAIAAGLADSLLLRCAYVTLKQHRPLVIVHREIPFTAIDLENMLKITRTGGIICSAAPGFYHAPATIAELVDSVVGRVLDLLHIEHSLRIRWDK